MLVIARQPNESLMVGDDLLLTVARIRGENVTMRVVFMPVGNRPSPADELYFTLKRDDRRELESGISCQLVDVRAEKARLGIEAPKTVAVQRKEIYDALMRENKRGNGDLDSESGFSGSPVPAKPKPSSDSGSAKLQRPEPEA